jgi:hypothetical protein
MRHLCVTIALDDPKIHRVMTRNTKKGDIDEEKNHGDLVGFVLAHELAVSDGVG